jgi:hypothetical protein
MSFPPPGGKGTIRRTGRAGQASAPAVADGDAAGCALAGRGPGQVAAPSATVDPAAASRSQRRRPSDAGAVVLQDAIVVLVMAERSS